MKTRLIKEARQLLPVLLGTLGLMLAPRLLWGEWTEQAGVTTVFAFGLGCVLMGGLSFGSELQHRTLGLLLSQPLQRSVLWREKMLVLGTGIAVSFGVVLAGLEFGRLRFALEPGVTWALALVALCAFCGAPWLTLLARSGIGGVVFAALLPGALAGITGALTERWFPSVGGERVVPVLVVIYCAVAYWRGYRTFQGLEARDVQGTELALPARVEGALARGFGALLPAIRGPFEALLRKELRLQQMSFVLAAVSSAFAVMALVTHFIDREWSEVLFTLDFAIYLILLPFMAGAMAVAEERALGVAEWHLTLPASALKQWSAKMLVTLPTSLVLGLALPAVFFLAGDIITHWPDWQWQSPPLDSAVLIVLGQLLVTSVALYAASYCASTLRAILLAFGIMVAGITLLVGEANLIQIAARLRYSAHPYFDFLTRGSLQQLIPLYSQPSASGASREHLVWAISCMGLVLVTGLLLMLGFANFRRCGVSMPRFLLQLLGILLVVAWLGLRVFSLMS